MWIAKCAGGCLAALSMGCSAWAAGSYSMLDAERIAGAGNEATKAYVMCLEKDFEFESTQIADQNFALHLAVRTCASLEGRVVQEKVLPTMIVSYIYACGFSPRATNPKECK